jgi:hypothetical protein
MHGTDWDGLSRRGCCLPCYGSKWTQGHGPGWGDDRYGQYHLLLLLHLLPLLSSSAAAATIVASTNQQLGGALPRPTCRCPGVV